MYPHLCVSVMPYTCLKVMYLTIGEKLKYLSSDDIEAMTDGEFEDCRRQFGKGQSLSDDDGQAVRDAIMDRIREKHDVRYTQFSRQYLSV